MTRRDFFSLPCALLPVSLQPDALPSLLGELERWEASTLRPLEWNRRFLAEHFCRHAAADFHHEYDRELHNLHLTRGVKRSDIAPRGGAKSTWKTLAYPLRCALEGWEPYTVILSDSSDQANQQLGHIKEELENNSRIADVYPELAGEGPVWRENKIQLANGCVVEALGAGKKIRGRRNRSARPSLVVIDDVQSNQDVISESLRARAWLWVTREVIPAGDERTNFLGVGSAIHRDAVAVRLGKLADWTGRTYKAVHAWPERMDLWAEFERLASNLADDDRKATALAFYARNGAAMDRGARVYWPSKFPLVEIMLLRASIGARAFDTEYQGIPGAIDGSRFPPEYFEHAGLWFDYWPDEDLVLTVNTLDPSRAKTDRSDWQAHVSASLATDGTIYAECRLDREAVPAMVERALTFAAERTPHCLVVETNQGLDLLLPEFERQAAVRGLVAPLQGLENYSVGKQRIERLVSYFARKQIRIRNTAGGRLLVEQLLDFPNGDHDDGPDALEIAIRMIELLTSGAQ